MKFIINNQLLKRRAFILPFFLIVHFSCDAQSQDSVKLNNDFNRKLKRNIISLELGGNGFYYSINYSRVLSRTLILRTGFEYLTDKIFIQEFQFPIELYLNPVIGKNSNNHLEFGGGATPIFEFQQSRWEIAVFGRIGYGFHKPESAFYFRIGYTPFFYPDISDKIIQSFGGISIGYYF